MCPACPPPSEICQAGQHGLACHLTFVTPEYVEPWPGLDTVLFQ